MEDPENDFFVVVDEHMPQLIGGLEELHQQIQYPKRAEKAGIEGRVMIQFIITENGEVEIPLSSEALAAGVMKKLFAQ